MLIIATEPFLVEGEDFPFIKLDEPVKRGSYLRSWAFLVETLRVGVEADVAFHCHILKSIREDELHGNDIGRVLELYRVLYGVYSTSSDPKTAKQLLRSVQR